MVFKQKQNGGAGASGNREDCEQYRSSNPVSYLFPKRADHNDKQCRNSNKK